MFLIRLESRHVQWLIYLGSLEIGQSLNKSMRLEKQAWAHNQAHLKYEPSLSSKIKGSSLVWCVAFSTL